MRSRGRTSAAAGCSQCGARRPPERPGGEPVEGEPSPFDSPTTLYLVDPEGGRYPITTFPAPGENGVTPSLVDWSGDGTRALVYQQGPEDGTVIQVDLRSGKQTSFPVKRGFDITPRFSRPRARRSCCSRTSTSTVRRR